MCCVSVPTKSAKVSDNKNTSTLVRAIMSVGKFASDKSFIYWNKCHTFYVTPNVP